MFGFNTKKEADYESSEEAALWREYDYWDNKYTNAKNDEELYKAHDEMERVKDQIRYVRSRY